MVIDELLKSETLCFFGMVKTAYGQGTYRFGRIPWEEWTSFAISESSSLLNSLRSSLVMISMFIILSVISVHRWVWKRSPGLVHALFPAKLNGFWVGFWVSGSTALFL